jgi:hypothetical protein
VKRLKPGVTQIAITALSAELISTDFIWFLCGPAGVRLVGGGSTLAVAAKSYCNGGSSLSGGAITGEP